jgi:DNA-binding CsgD family transcriptional regulator
MTLSVSGIVPAQPAQTLTPVRSAIAQAPQPQPSEDTVAISEAAQVSHLITQGLSPSEIADALGIPVSNVDSDLGIAAAKVTSGPTVPSAASATPAATPPPVATAPAATFTTATSAR